MKDYAREKIEKLERIYGRMTTVELTLDVGHDQKIVEIVAHANRHSQLVCRAESPDMYAAIDLAEDKLARQLVRHKQKLTDHHRRDGHHGGTEGAARSAGAAVPAGAEPGVSDGGEASEETYEEIVEKMR